jgi:hypothetical protein
MPTMNNAFLRKIQNIQRLKTSKDGLECFLPYETTGDSILQWTL